MAPRRRTRADMTKPLTEEELLQGLGFYAAVERQKAFAKLFKKILWGPDTDPTRSDTKDLKK